MSLELHNTENPLSNAERLKLNENWQRIISGYGHLQQQIKVLAGGAEVDELIQRLEDAITKAEADVLASIEANNQALQTALNTIAETLTVLSDALSAAGTATEEAVAAKNAALQVTQDAQTAITQMQSLINNFNSRGPWNSTTTFKVNNLVEADGKTYIALQDNMNKPVTNTAYWALFADKGVKGDKGDKGDTGAALSILGNLTDPSQLPTSGTAGDAYTVNGELYVWSENTNAWENVGNIKGEKGDKGDAGDSAYEVAVNSGFVGTESEWLASLKGQKGDPGADADLTEITQTVSALDTKVTTHLDDYTLLESQVTNHESRINLLENGSTSTKADVAGLNREVAYLKLQQEASERIEGGTVFADDYKGNRFGFTLDEANSSGFKIKNGKLVMVEDVEQSYNVPDETVVASAYSTAGNGGRKLVRLSNGWLVAAVVDSGAQFYVSKDNGNTWSSLCRSNLGALKAISIVAKGTVVHAMYHSNGSGIPYTSFDATEVTAGSLVMEKVYVESSQTATSGLSLAINEAGTELHAVWASKNATYPNPFNIRYVKSTDGGVTWSAVEQVTVQTASADSNTMPTIVVTNSLPFISYVVGDQDLRYLKFNGTSWTINNGLNRIFFNGYTQSFPLATLDKEGLIANVWHGRDATHTTTEYIRFSKSLDGGVNWSTMKKLVPGINATLTVDKNNKYIITYSDNGVIKQIESIDKGENWTVPINIANGTNPSSLYDSNLGLEITKAPVIHMSASTVKFNGDWIEQAEAPTTTATAIYDIPSTDYVGAFVQKEGDVTVTAQLNDTLMEMELEDNEYQFVGTLATESPAKLKLQLSRPNITNGENDAITRILGGRS